MAVYVDHSLGDLMKLDKDFEDFLERYVDSFIKWEIIQFYHDHPRTLYSQETLAKTLNRPGRSLRKELKELALEGLLHEVKGEKSKGFIYDLPEQNPLTKAVAQFASYCQDREGRLRIIYKILKDGKALNA